MYHHIPHFFLNIGEMPERARSMKLKLDQDGHVVMSDGKPIYEMEDGKELPFDAPRAMEKIHELNAENASRRKDSEKLTEKLKLFEGIEDPEVAKKAIETVANLDAKKLIDAGEVEKLKKQYSETFDAELGKTRKEHEKKIKDFEELLKGKDSTIRNLIIGSNFAKSKYFAGENPKTTLPWDMAQEVFGKYFKPEADKDGSLRLIGYYSGEKILSRDPARIGEPAEFEEAIGFLIDKYPQKEWILRNSPGGPGGSGNLSYDKESQAIVLSRKDAKDPDKYRAARKMAIEKGLQIQIADK